MASEQKFERVYEKSKKRIIINNFIGGIAWGVGSVIGATIIIGSISYIFVKTQRIPIIGDLMKNVVLELEEAKSETKDVIDEE